MDVLSEMTRARTYAPEQTAAWNPHICESAIGWLRHPPDAPLEWDTAMWEEARWAIAVHGIAPLLYRNLHSTPAWAYLAPSLRHWLQEQYQLNGERVCRLKAELEHILAAANAAAIPVVPLKGSTALYLLYTDDPALRPMADLDVLVRPADEARFATLLTDLGYLPEESTPRHRSFTHPDAQQVVSVRGEHPDNPRGVQVHAGINEMFWGTGFDVTDALWEGNPAPFGSATGWLSHPVGFMQHLLIHGSADVIAGKVRLVRLYDIVLLAAKFDDAMWQALIETALSRGEARWFYAALALITRYLDAPIPARVMRALGSATPPALRSFLEQTTLYYLSFCNPIRVSLRERLTWHRPGRERMAALWHCVLPPTDQIREYYPRVRTTRELAVAYGRHIYATADGFRRSLLKLPRRSWLRREQGGK